MYSYVRIMNMNAIKFDFVFDILDFFSMARYFIGLLEFPRML